MSEMDAKEIELVVVGSKEAVYGTTYHEIRISKQCPRCDGGAMTDDGMWTKADERLQ